jgi:hypothetical protein
MTPVHRETPQTVPFSWPDRLPVPAAESKVSQKATVVPNCRPQFPATGGEDPPPPDPDPADAVQVAVVPPLEPPQLHVHGPEPATDDAVPAQQRFVEGEDDTVVPFAVPHTPLTGD